MLRTPDGHSRLELSRFLVPPVVADHRNAPVNSLGYLRVMFAVDDIDETLPGSASTARSSSAAKSSSTKTRFGSATSADPKAYLSGSLRTSAEQHHENAPASIAITPLRVVDLLAAAQSSGEEILARLV